MVGEYEKLQDNDRMLGYAIHALNTKWLVMFTTDILPFVRYK